MLYVDIPTLPELRALVATRSSACVTLYLPTTPFTREAQADRIDLKNLSTRASDQLQDAGSDKRSIQAILAHVNDLIEDDEFWRFQANSLVVLATRESLRSFRLPNRLQSGVEVSDRFHLKPLLRALTFPHEAFVLALSQGSVRLIEVFSDQAPRSVKVTDMPKDAASSVGRASVRDRSPSGRIQGAEGQKVLLKQYARQVDRALRPVVAGRDAPLLLAALPPLDAIYRSVNTHPRLANLTLRTSPDEASEQDLARQARPVLDDLYASEVRELQALFEARADQGRATGDVAVAARAATLGAIAALLVDMDESLPGTIDEVSGAVSFAQEPGGTSYDIVGEIAGRALLTGARVLAVRKDDVPGGGALAAILRYPLASP